jgi:hypothetical protein
MLEDTWFLRSVGLLFDNTSSTSPPRSRTFQLISRITLNPTPEPKTDPLTLKWEKRKKVGYAPTLRSGCTMALWPARGMGVLFGGVTDEDTNEETLESVFHNDMYVTHVQLSLFSFRSLALHGLAPTSPFLPSNATGC